MYDLEGPFVISSELNTNFEFARVNKSGNYILYSEKCREEVEAGILQELLKRG